MKCPVCDNVNNAMVCPKCGFDSSRDYGKYPTFGPVGRVTSASALRKQFDKPEEPKPVEPIPVQPEPPAEPRKKNKLLPLLIAAAFALTLGLGVWIGAGIGAEKPLPSESGEAGPGVQKPLPSESEGNEQVNPEHITLNVWSPAEDQADVNSWLIQMQSAFQVEHPEYIITWEEAVCDEGDIDTMLNAAPDVAPDIYLFASTGMENLVQAHVLSPLEGQFLEQVGNDVSVTSLNTVTASDGKVYGFPVEPNTWFMYYNKSILSEEDVRSMEACLEKGIVAFEVKNSWYLPAFFFAAGGTLFGENGNDAAAGINFGGEIGINATNAVLDLMDNPNFRIGEYGYGNEGLKNGTVAAYFSGSWDYPGLYDALGDNLGAVPAPTVMVGGAPAQLKAYANTKAVGVNPNAKNIEVAMEFAAFLASADSQLLRYQLHGITPAATTLIDHPDVAASVAAVAELNTMTDASVVLPGIHEMGGVWGPIGTYGESLANGTINRDNVTDYVLDLDISLK